MKVQRDCGAEDLAGSVIDLVFDSPQMVRRVGAELVPFGKYWP